VGTVPVELRDENVYGATIIRADYD
jgi:hypothetical protein